MCLVISVDIQGVFDNLAFMKDNNFKLSIRPVCGTPQGGVLSSRIWNLAFDPLLKLLNSNSPYAPVGFADDGALCFRGFDPETLVELAQPKINQAVRMGGK